ncbi:hypothetical protein RHJ63_10695 [Thermosynechococcus sp. JY1334]|uniref:hypothetical protein n=1 Tax=unclassified Thermosynechococcus TaxID=2622553 RepID=UPI002673E472|nr:MULTISPECIES: hypothetical protein [unclassified Thermosynechococcus]MDR7898776.1 hypothetical protein [Thermosynechococcus sp. JY1332]MDR7906180.1 hypothetical protein [Thermosynechococcus sp. JY1334]MDR7994001.1 hypothetical protein [Thermosynechococcus sp. TG252]WKT85906.1 hypothetical protein QYC30_10720 [Thermosynechococcus sp. JY1339]WNC54849.1 hypothetical protein RHJ31_10705 [Thermosynechococcus sp. JY1331]
MMHGLSLAPRYRLDDVDPWLLGIDPSRHYWLQVNGDPQQRVAIPGVCVQSISELREIMDAVRSLLPGQQLQIQRAATCLEIHCVAENLLAIAHHVDGAPVWHLFDRETLESLVISAHPHWQCRPEDVELGRQQLWQSFQLPVAA